MRREGGKWERWREGRRKGREWTGLQPEPKTKSAPMEVLYVAVVKIPFKNSCIRIVIQITAKI